MLTQKLTIKTNYIYLFYFTDVTNELPISPHIMSRKVTPFRGHVAVHTIPTCVSGCVPDTHRSAAANPTPSRYRSIGSSGYLSCPARGSQQSVTRQMSHRWHCVSAGTRAVKARFHGHVGRHTFHQVFNTLTSCIAGV